jgi:hypothetical protein
MSLNVKNDDIEIYTKSRIAEIKRFECNMDC